MMCARSAKRLAKIATKQQAMQMIKKKKIENNNETKKKIK